MSDIVDEPQVESQNTTEEIEKPNAAIETAPTDAPTDAPTETAEGEPKTPEQIRGEYFITDLDKKLTEEDVKVAFTIILDPKSSQPIVSARGSTYQLARVLVDMARYFKEQVAQDLKV